MEASSALETRKIVMLLAVILVVVLITQINKVSSNVNIVVGEIRTTNKNITNRCRTNSNIHN